MFLFLTYFTLYNGLQFHPPPWIHWFKCIIFNSWVIFHGVYEPQLPYPFICWWTSRLLPCPGYCKQCCDEHWGTRVSFSSGFLGVYDQKWDCWVIWQLFFLVAEWRVCVRCLESSEGKGWLWLLLFLPARMLWNRQNWDSGCKRQSLLCSSNQMNCIMMESTNSDQREQKVS